MNICIVDLFKWNYNANEHYIKLFKTYNALPSEYLNILQGIMTEHERWLNRISAVNDSFKVEIMGCEELTAQNSLLQSLTSIFLSSASFGENLDWRFAYVSAKGQKLDISLIEAYFHILTFSEFERGRLAELLRQNGGEQPKKNFLSVKYSLQ